MCLVLFVHCDSKYPSAFPSHHRGRTGHPHPHLGGHFAQFKLPDTMMTHHALRLNRLLDIFEVGVGVRRVMPKVPKHFS